MGNISSGNQVALPEHNMALCCIDKGERAELKSNVDVNQRKKDIAKVVKKMRQARNLDLCFLVDVTGSMQKWIDGVKQSIRRIVDLLTMRENNQTKSVVKKIRIAFVGYRDFNDARQFELLDFTQSVDEFYKFCDSIKAVDGGDTAEDVFGGIDLALKLNWTTDGSSRMLFHIADAPCHGREFNSGCSDDYQSGDPLNRSMYSLFNSVNDKQIQYYFGKINESTTKMVERFASAYKGELIVYDVKDVECITSSLISSASISVTFPVDDLLGRLSKWDIDSAEPNWSEIPQLSGLMYSYEAPNSIEELIFGATLQQSRSIEACIQIAPKPFANGVERLAYYGRAFQNKSDFGNSVKIVAKKYIERRDGGEFINTACHYEAGIQLQTIAAFMASKFNEKLNKIGRGYTIKFLEGKIFSYLDNKSGRVYMLCERRYPDDFKFLRFTNNMDYTMLEATAKIQNVDLDFVNQLTAFSHWTFQATGGFLMVVDLQGIIYTDITGKRQIELTDPAIHCRNLDCFGRTNFGEVGMKGFFTYHCCNEICRSLNLGSPKNFHLFDSDEEDDEK